MRIKQLPFSLMQDGDEKGFGLVYLKDDKPHCRKHGAMNKLPSHDMWRCFSEYGYKHIEGQSMPRFIDRVCIACCVEDKRIICGKCNTLQDMSKKFWGKKEHEFSWWCPKCKDRISQGACKSGKVSKT